MPTSLTRSCVPRKAPVQARATETVGAIFEATVQLLLKDDPTELTTIRIAKRAGVSVGTYYQYFPNKEALLLAVVSQHLRRVTPVLERACLDNSGQSLTTMVSGFVGAYFGAQLRHWDAARVVYRMASGIGAGPIMARERELVVRAFSRMLRTSPEVPAGDVEMIAFTFFGAISGAMRAALESPYGTRWMAEWQSHLERLGQAYLASFRTQM